MDWFLIACWIITFTPAAVTLIWVIVWLLGTGRARRKDERWPGLRH